MQPGTPGVRVRIGVRFRIRARAGVAVRNIVVKSPIYALDYGFNISVTFITIGRGKQAIL